MFFIHVCNWLGCRPPSKQLKSKALEGGRQPDRLQTCTKIMTPYESSFAYFAFRNFVSSLSAKLRTGEQWVRSEHNVPRTVTHESPCLFVINLMQMNIVPKIVNFDFFRYFFVFFVLSMPSVSQWMRIAASPQC